MELAEIYAANTCGYTEGEWRSLHSPSGWVLDRTPPADYEIARLGDCHPAFAAFAQSVASGKACGLLATGKPGRGKTYAALAVLRSLSCDMGVGMATDAEIAMDAEGAWTERTGRSAVIARYCSPRLLAIDDLGKAAYTPKTLEAVFAVIDARIRSRRPTIVTSQYNAKGLLAKMSVSGDSSTAEAIASRLNGFSRVHLDGADRRVA